VPLKCDGEESRTIIFSLHVLAGIENLCHEGAVVVMGISSRRSFIRSLVFGGEPVVAHAGERALVCVFLRGGADTLNMVVPYADGDYYANRPTLAIVDPGKHAADAAIRLDDFYAFHPKLKPLVAPYAEGRLGIVQAVGSDNPTGSHFDAQDQIEHGAAYGSQLGGGWLARHLRTRAGQAPGPLSAVSMGAAIPESLRGAGGASAIRSLEDVHLPVTAASPQRVAAALATMYGTQVGVLGRQGTETLKLLQRVEALHGKPYRPEAGAEYPAGDFGGGMHEIARLIKAGVGLEVACIDLGSWDTHFFQGTAGGQQASLIDVLAKGLSAFDADMKFHRDRATTIVMTEFGRRLYENGSLGTDHGRGFAFFAMGAGIRGGKVHGDWPGLKEEPRLPGPGGMEVRIDYRSVLSEILAGPIRNDRVGEVFTGFKATRVGLAS
jgi:uncharacterized protein (DUF1501 family)